MLCKNGIDENSYSARSRTMFGNFPEQIGFYAEGPSTTHPASRLPRRRSHHNFHLHTAIKTRQRLLLTEADPVVAHAEQSTVQTVKQRHDRRYKNRAGMW